MLVYFARAVVGIALLLSAGWKLRHQSEFRASYRAMLAGPLRRLDGVAAKAVPLLEIMLGVGMLIRSPIERAIVSAAGLLILGFTLLLSRAGDSRAGCGCWRTPLRGAIRAPHLVRNGSLLVLAIAGTWTVGTLPTVGLLFGVGAGFIFAVVLMEIPEVALVALGDRTGGDAR